MVPDSFDNPAERCGIFLKMFKWDYFAQNVGYSNGKIPNSRFYYTIHVKIDCIRYYKLNYIMHDIQISNIKLHLHWYLIWKFPFDRMLNQFNANCSGKMYLLLIEFFGLTHLNREPACSNKIEGFSLSKQQIAFEKSKSDGIDWKP